LDGMLLAGVALSVRFHECATTIVSTIQKSES
jgi:hypothetical protein